MDDRVILIVACVVAVAGLILLFMVKPSAEQRFVLSGTIVSVEKGKSVALVNVTLIGKNLSAGPFSEAVFWNQNSFIVLPR